MPEPSPLSALMRQICEGDPDDARLALCEALNAIADGDCESLDQAFGLQARPGQRKASTVLRQLERDQALVKAANQLSGKPSGKARDLARMLGRYAATTWRRTGQKADCPHPANSVEAGLWRALRASDGQVLSARSIRKLLAASYPYSRPT